MSAKSQCVRMALLRGAVGLLALSAAGPSFVRSSGEYGPLAVEGHFTRIKLPERSMTTDRNGSEQPQDLTEEEALLANRSLRFSAHPIETAWPFGTSPGVRLAAEYDPAIDCLTAAIYYEAAREGELGQRAVAQVVLNRVRHPAFPSSVCGVVYQGSERRTGCQFTFTCDGSLLRRPSARGWAAARRIAVQALQGRVEPSVGMATHYHADYVFPYWAPTLDKIAAIDSHIFYRWSGSWGKRHAFSQSYKGESLRSPFNEVERLVDGVGLALATGATITGGAHQPDPVIEEARPRAEKPRTLRADEEKGTLKLDGTPSKLVINSEEK